MASSSVAIANRALQQLGAGSISALDQGNDRALAMNTAYEPLRRRLLRKYNWSFAIKRASIAALANNTAWGGLKQYLLPNDFLRLVRNKEIDFTDVEHDWTIEHNDLGKVIVTADDSPLQFRYIADVTNTTLFDATFDEALATLMALETCERITQSNTKKADLAAAFKDVVAEAKLTQAIEKGGQEPVQSPWLDARV